jgi:hypothetical protein
MSRSVALVHEGWCVLSRCPLGTFGVGRPAPSALVQLTVAIRNRDSAQLEQRTLEISDPRHPSYGQWLSLAELNALCALGPEHVAGRFALGLATTLSTPCRPTVTCSSSRCQWASHPSFLALSTTRVPRVPRPQDQFDGTAHADSSSPARVGGERSRLCITHNMVSIAATAQQAAGRDGTRTVCTRRGSHERLAGPFYAACTIQCGQYPGRWWSLKVRSGLLQL